jgi:NodT family efflux transporter outer membrane factor (OMF) lipoprotein
VKVRRLSILNMTAIASTTIASMIVGCSSFGPERRPPVIATSDHYSVSEQPEQLPQADEVAQALAQGERPVPQWWKAYGSPQLTAMVEEGLNNSPSLAAAQATLNSAREQLRGQIGQNLLPQVDLSFDPARERALGIPILPQQTFIENVFMAQAQASYTFDFFGAALLADRALAGQVHQQAYQLAATRRALATNIVVATINVASMQDQVNATEKLVALGEQRAQQMADRYSLGSASRQEMLSAEQDAANAAATLPALRAQALAVRHAQAILLGRTPDNAPPAISLDALQVPPVVPVSVPSQLLHQRPDILAAEAAVRAAADAAGAATAAMFPSLTLNASWGHGGFDWSYFSSPAGVVWGVSGSLTQPLFHGGALFARRRQYQATYVAAVGQYKQTVLSAFRTVADTLVSLDEDANTVVQARRSDEAARAADEDTTSRYQLGATSFYLTLTAGQQYQNAHVQYIRARAARLADTAALFDSMGDPPVDEVHPPLVPLARASLEH